MRICKNEKEKVLEAIRQSKIDAAAVSFNDLVDDIILEMQQHGLLSLLENAFIDKRDDNAHIPLHLMLTLGIAAKMKLKTSLTDIPYAINDAQTLAELGYNLIDIEHGLEEGLLAEGTLRNWINKYESPISGNVYDHEFVVAYNQYVQKQILPTLNIQPNIHILDCTKVKVKLKNKNYEHSEVVTDEEGPQRGYKIGTLRGIMKDTGILEEITLGSIKTHDLELCRNMLLSSEMLQPGDILINDRGFLSRAVMNALKTTRSVDTYIPVRKNMEIYITAVSLANEQNKWQKHPNRKRKTQRIALIRDLGPYWQSDNVEKDVPLNASVVHDTKENKYFVFITTDTSKTAKQIIKTYELRPEIEEDYRQIKDFWKLEDFKSTKYSFIVFHIVMVLIGYMYFQIFKTLDGNERYQRKSLPVLLKNYVQKDRITSIIVYAGAYFGIFDLLEFMDIYASCNEEIKKRLRPILANT